MSQSSYDIPQQKDCSQDLASPKDDDSSSYPVFNVPSNGNVQPCSSGTGYSDQFRGTRPAQLKESSWRGSAASVINDSDHTLPSSQQQHYFPQNPGASVAFRKPSGPPSYQVYESPNLVEGSSGLLDGFTKGFCGDVTSFRPDLTRFEEHPSSNALQLDQNGRVLYCEDPFTALRDVVREVHTAGPNETSDSRSHDEKKKCKKCKKTYHCDLDLGHHFLIHTHNRRLSYAGHHLWLRPFLESLLLILCEGAEQFICTKCKDQRVFHCDRDHRKHFASHSHPSKNKKLLCPVMQCPRHSAQSGGQLRQELKGHIERAHVRGCESNIELKKLLDEAKEVGTG